MLPARQQESELLVTTDKGGELGATKCLETALSAALTQGLPSMNRLCDTFERMIAKIGHLEQVTQEPAGARSDDDRSRFGQSLQTRCKIWCLAHHRLFLRGTLTDQIADDDKPRGDADPTG